MQPQKLIIQIEDSLLAELVYWWIYYDKPCSLLLMKPRTDGLVAVKAVVEDGKTEDFIDKAKAKTGCKIHYVE